jgi:hypothetical protein
LRRPSSVLLAAVLLAAAGAASAQRGIGDGAKCEQFLRTLPVWKTPEVQMAVTRTGATLGDVLDQLDTLAQAGNADAQYGIGRMMQHGVCAEPNTGGALEYLTRAALGGSRPAQEVLAAAYYAGKEASAVNRLDIPPDPVQSYLWYRVLGNQQGVIQARRRMTPSEVDEAERLAREQLARQSGEKPKQ